jgi:hypothetical protein
MFNYDRSAAVKALLVRLDRPTVSRPLAAPAAGALLAVALVHLIDGPSVAPPVTGIRR